MPRTELKYGRGYKIVQSVILASLLFHCISSFSILFSLFFCFGDCVILLCSNFSVCTFSRYPSASGMISHDFFRVSIS